MRYLKRIYGEIEFFKRSKLFSRNYKFHATGTFLNTWQHLLRQSNQPFLVTPQRKWVPPVITLRQSRGRRVFLHVSQYSWFSKSTTLTTCSPYHATIYIDVKLSHFKGLTVTEPVKLFFFPRNKRSSAMKAVILRGGSIPVTSPALTASSPRVSLSRQSSFAGLYSADQRTLSSPLISLLSPMDKRKPKGTHPHIRRALSDSDIARSVSRSPAGSRCISAGIPEEECASDGEVDREFRALVTGNGSDRAASFAPVWPESSIPNEEIGFSGDGLGNSGKHGGNHGDDSYDHKSKIRDYYRGMLNLNPADSLLLRNYGRFLHEVKDLTSTKTIITTTTRFKQITRFSLVFRR